jgi:hypothetical protein
MANEPVTDAQGDIGVTIKEDVLHCTIPLKNPDGDLNKAKIVCYGALKLAEEQASVYFMQEAIRKRQNAILRPSGSIKPGVV